MTRRQMIASMAAIVASPAWLKAQVPNAPTRLRVLTPTLSLSDFTCLGAFQPPTPQNETQISGRAITHRYEKTGLRLYSLSPLGQLISYSPPPDSMLRTAAPFNTAANLTAWGDVWQNSIVQLVNDGFTGLARVGYSTGLRADQLFWDEIDQRLYWTRQTVYPASAPDGSDTCLGYSVLNDDTHSGVGVAMWRLSPTTEFGNRWCGQPIRIPQQFADAYCGGRSLGVGFQSALSIAAFGPKGNGPSLFAMYPPSLATSPVSSDPVNTPGCNYYKGGLTRIMHYPYVNTFPGTRAARPRMPVAVDEPELVGGLAANRTYWTAYDLSNSGVWIEGQQKSGLFVFASLIAGNLAASIVASPAPALNDFSVDNIGQPNDILPGDIISFPTNRTITNDLYKATYGTVASVSGTRIFLVPGSKKSAGSGPNGTGNYDDSAGIPLVGGQVVCGVKYYGGGPFRSRQLTAAFTYDVRDLVKGATGAVLPNAIQPFDCGELRLPNISYPIPGALPGTGYTAEPRGMTYDTITRRLYVYAGFALSGYPLVYVFSVNC